MLFKHLDFFFFFSSIQPLRQVHSQGTSEKTGAVKLLVAQGHIATVGVVQTQIV